MRLALWRAVSAFWPAFWLMLGTAALAAPVVVQVEVDLSAQIAARRFNPEADQVGIRGSHAPLNWQVPVLARPVGKGRYAAELRFEQPPSGGQPVQYKFRIERAGQAPDEGWEQGRNHALVLAGSAPRIQRAFDVPAPALPAQRTGHIERLGLLPSAHVAPRAVQVWLPPGYAEHLSRRYPVLYLHDGQNVFDAVAAGAEWQVDETAQRLAEAGRIEPPIVVAVDSGPNRGFDYTPTAALVAPQRTGTGHARQQGGGAPAYARFLIEELKPLIDQRYRTRPAAQSTAVGGASLGGLVSLWLALHHADTFGAALVVSPSLWWDDGLAWREVLATPLHAARHPRLWLDMGALEGAQALPEARRLHEALLSRGWGGPTLAYHEVTDGSHDEASWAARVEGMLVFLYGSPATLAR